MTIDFAGSEQTTLSISLTKGEKETIRREARTYRLTTSAFVRKLLQYYIEMQRQSEEDVIGREET